MKAKELRERSDQDLTELTQQLRRDMFGIRMKNHTGQLDDTSQLRKTRRDLARIAHIQGLRATERLAQQASDQQSGSKT
jgi:large subunit ribosomal protein L29